MYRIFIGLVLSVLGTGIAAAQTEPPSTAERVYAAARPRLVQIRTLLAAAGQQSSLGSGFLVSADGLAITNYHVISQYALEPKTYRLEYAAVDGSRGALSLLAIDLANDLALVRLDKRDLPFFVFDERALSGSVPKGERLYSMGNPLDLGFTIVEGTYNGLVERSYGEQVHFAGALNPGMSGGPTVTADGRIAGVNVARHVGGELVSFLVPAHFAAALLKEAPAGDPPAPMGWRREITRQLTLRQAGLAQSAGDLGFRSVAFGPYQAGESAAPWFTCWAQTNDGQIPKPRATVNTTHCISNSRLFIAQDLTTGFIQLSHSYIRSSDLNPFQFAAFLTQQNQALGFGGWSKKWYTAPECHEDFVRADATRDHPPLRVRWCAQAYREFAGLYDVAVTAITQDHAREALMSRLRLEGVTYDNAIALTKHFLEAVQWTK